jgi:hypothetical protein
MTRVLSVAFALSFVLSSNAFAAPPASVARPQTPAHASGDGWPTSPAGIVARGWVEAFSSGDSAMRIYLANNIRPQSLAERGIEERLARYHELRDKYGKLVLASLDSVTATEIKVRLMASDATLHTFVFTVEPGVRAKLASIKIVEGMPGGFGAFHH